MAIGDAPDAREAHHPGALAREGSPAYVHTTPTDPWNGALDNNTGSAVNGHPRGANAGHVNQSVNIVYDLNVELLRHTVPYC